MKKLHLVPVPDIISESDCIAAKPDFAHIKADILLIPAINAAEEYAARAGICGEREISLLYSETYKGEEWMMNSDEGGVDIACGSVKGAQRALAILLQIAAQCEDGVPCFVMKSSPDTDYRAVMIDLARNWHEYHYLREYVDMCWLYGIPYLHLHFTDDQSYTLPSVKYPKLSSAGRSYTWEQMVELDNYAASRGVEIVPEIDVPGHCTSFDCGYPELFGNQGIIIQTEESMNAMAELFGELCVMFPHSHYIHIGGDEADIGRWCRNEKCREYALSCGIDFDMEDKRFLAERMLANFVDKMADAVRAHGRMPVAWEGFGKCVNEYVNREILMESWENYYQTTPELLEGDFNIINSSWCPMYIVTPRTYWTTKEIYDWSIYKWQPIHPASIYLGKTLKIEPDKRVKGGQLLAWGDSIGSSFEILDDGIRAEQSLVEERAAVLSERTWNVNPKLDAEEFIADSKEALALLTQIRNK